MAVLKILRCKNCTSPLPEGTTTCPKCHAVNLVQSEVNPLHIPAGMTNDYIEFFKQQTDANPKDTNALFGMGLVYMGLKNYELAQRNFKLAVDQSPLEPDIYYYFALSLFEGHNPMHLSNNVTNRIEEWLHTATNRQAKRKYLILQMILRQGAFVANGLQVKGEQPIELFNRIIKMVPEADEIVELEEHVQITDPQTLSWLSQLKANRCDNVHPAVDASPQTSPKFVGKNPCESFSDIRMGVQFGVYHRIDNTTIRDTYMNFSNEDDIDSSIAALQSEEKRAEFFDYLYEPSKPEMQSKPFYPIFKILKMCIGYALLWIIILIALSASDFGFAEMTIDKVNKKTKAEVAEFFENNVVIFSKLNDDAQTVHYGHITQPAENLKTVKEYAGFERSQDGLIAAILFVLPLFLLVLRIIIVITQVAIRRNNIRKNNRELKRQYGVALNMHNTRPTKTDYMEFCRHYLSQYSPCLDVVGDPVAIAMRENNMDEKDMQGKLLFINYFENEDDSGEYTYDPLYTMRYLYYVIAIPQKDKLLMLKNRWDTLSNEFGMCDMESVFYRNILSVNVCGDQITIEKVGGTVSGIVLAPNGESLMEYQDYNPENKMTYSVTRTSNSQVFVKALEKLIASC